MILRSSVRIALLISVFAAAVYGCSNQTVSSLLPQSGADSLHPAPRPLRQWIQKKPMPTHRGQLAVVALNDELYALGGETYGQVVSTVEMYDHHSNTWIEEPPMPTARVDFAAGIGKNFLYAIGGDDGYHGFINTVEIFDPGTESWTTGPPMPTRRSSLAVGAINGVLYAVGGYGWPVSTIHAYPGPLTAVEAFDPATGRWTSKAPLPTPREAFAVSVVSGKLYAIGGYDTTFLNDVEAYDPITDTWTKRAPMPTARANLAACAVNGIIYAVGGLNTGAMRTVEAYNPVTDTWTRLASMPTGLNGLGVGVVGGEIHALRGAHHYVFNPQ